MKNQIQKRLTVARGQWISLPHLDDRAPDSHLRIGAEGVYRWGISDTGVRKRKNPLGQNKDRRPAGDQNTEADVCDCILDSDLTMSRTLARAAQHMSEPDLPVSCRDVMFPVEANKAFPPGYGDNVKKPYVDRFSQLLFPFEWPNPDLHSHAKPWRRVSPSIYRLISPR